MRLQYIFFINLFCAILYFPTINAQCTLPGGSYQWGLSNLDNYISNNCGGSPLNIIIPTNASISLKNNDPWDLTSYGAIMITIEGMGSLNFNGTDKLTMATSSTLVINESTNTSAINLSGNINNDRLVIGSTTYTGNDFSNIITTGVAPLTSLPIELAKFYSYTNEKNEVQLNWETVSEINNEYFEIEHSLDGIDFEMIGRVQGNGTTNLYHQYRFVHLNPSNGNNYYRLKQVDYDSSFEYFNIISKVVKDEKAFRIKINSLRLLSIEINQPSKMVVYNMMGQVVFEDEIEEGINDFTFEDLVEGNYIVNVFYSGNIERVKISCSKKKASEIFRKPFFEQNLMTLMVDRRILT